ncbi:MAG: FAD-binding protein [Candidatus Bathyarchaeia archaeon]
MTVEYDAKQCDVLVIGAGGAGLRAAIEAHDLGTSVIVICKSLLGKAHTVMAEGGISAALGNMNPADSWQVHFADTIREGQHLGNYRMAEIFAKEAPEVVHELEHWGALFDRLPDGRIMQRPFGAHSYPRLCHVGDRTGLELIRTLQDQVLLRNVEILNEATVTSLLMNDDGSVAGAVILRIPTGTFVAVRAKAVILATGGGGRVYKVTSNSWESTGDGLTLAYNVGAELMDMEMVQFHPTGMVWPPGAKGILVTEAVRGEGGILLNVNDERFMSNYSPKRMELSARDVVARAIHAEITAGKSTEHGGVYLDIRHKGADHIKRKLPSMYSQFLEFAHIDITKEKMEVAPTVHYIMGGVRVEPETTETAVRGLYAAGEAAGGLHGANRLGGNSLSDILVFGKRAGKAAAAYAKKQSARQLNTDAVKSEIDRVLAPLGREGGENPFALRDELQETMQKHVGIIREANGLEAALVDIERIKHRAKDMSAAGSPAYNPALTTALDTLNMLTICEATVRSALMRKESRGAHTRSDYPRKDDENWKVNIVTQLRKGEMSFSTVKVPEMSPELARLLREEE